MEEKLRKGGLARLKPSATNNGRMRRDGYLNGTSLVTREEVGVWYNSDDSKGMRCDGETKLPPTCTIIPLYFDRVYQVLRARCAPQYSYRRHPGMACLLDPVSGREVFIKRDALEAL